MKTTLESIEKAFDKEFDKPFAQWTEFAVKEFYRLQITQMLEELRGQINLTNLYTVEDINSSIDEAIK